MLELANPSPSALWLLLGTFLASIFLVGKQSVEWWLRRSGRRWPGWQWLEWFCTATAVVAFAILAVDAVQSIHVLNRPEQSKLGQVAIILATCLLSWLFVCHAMRGQGGLEPSRIPVRSVLLMTCLVMASWSAQRYYCCVAPAPYFGPPIVKSSPHAAESRRFIGITDRGRDVTFLHWQPDSESHAAVVWSTVAEMIKNSPTSILRADADTRSNCHGWVFAGGRFLLDGAGVARILEDNGYVAVPQPQTRDVVIYRNRSGEISHTGLVRAVLADGTVLVESKWSVGARFLHLPQDQPYSSEFTYYRTSRPSHVVSVRFRSESQNVNSSKRGPTIQADAGGQRPSDPRPSDPRPSDPKTKNGDRVAVLAFRGWAAT